MAKQKENEWVISGASVKMQISSGLLQKYR